MSVRRILMASALCLFALPAWAQKQGAVAQPMIVLPWVDLLSPTAGQQFVAGQTVVLDAVGTPYTGEIQSTKVYLDGSLYASAMAAEVTANWTATLGTHTIYARTTDEAASKSSPTITITVIANTPPTVSLTAPANGAVYTVGAAVTMTATASDSDGSITKVEFYVDGAKVGQATSSPYTYNWTGIVGDHSVYAKATDNATGSTSTSAITIHGQPAVPTLTLPTTSSTGSYSASWTTSSGATHYELGEQVGAGSWTVIQDTSATSRSISGKTDGSYSYRVRACTGSAGDTSNCSGYSTSKTIVVTIPPQAPATPTLTLPTTSSTGSYSASWTSSSGATHYELGEKVGSGSWSVIQDTSATSRSISGKTDGSYSYRVRACTGSAGDTSNCSGYSTTKTVTVTITTPPPSVPTLTVPGTNSTGSYDATWTTSSGATHYELSEQVGGGSWTKIQDTSATSRSLSGKTNGSYGYRVRACTGSSGDTSNCSGYSTTKTITVTIPPPPVTLTRTYAYNSYQELCRVEEPEAGTTLMGYDGAGNLAWSASGLVLGTACSTTGNTTAINARKAVRTYDARNRVSTLTFPDANGNQSWTYTPDGLPSSVTTYNDAGASSVVNSYSYNKRRLLAGETQAAGSTSWSVGYGYDPNGNLSTLVYPEPLTASSSTLAYAPNALGQPTQAGTYATNVTYYPNGAIAGFTYGNGIVHTLTQNTRGLPDRSKDADGASSIHDDSYDYDAVGNVLAISDAVSGNRGNRDMVYDDLNRLASATSPMFGIASYSYDVLDNLTHVQVTAGSQPRNQDYCYDEHNRLTNLMTGGCSGTSVLGLGYDAQGNLANRNGTTHTFTFDYGNRLRTGELESYRYDVQGRRIRSSNSAGVIYSLYAQSGQLLFQQNERSAKRRQYIYLGGSLVAESDMPLVGSTATVTYQHTDALGSPVATTNSAKTVLQRSEYEPYGYLLNRTMEDGPGYTGHVTDAATGLVYMQQRYYDPAIGERFLSVDPVTAFSPGGAFNQYWYANANPYGFTDPDGRDPDHLEKPNECDAACWAERRRRWEEHVSEIKHEEAKARHGQQSNSSSVEVIFWDAVGSGRSSLGHVSVQINGVSYSFAAGGMDVRAFSAYRLLNTFRNGHGYVLNLNDRQAAAVLETLSSYGKPYNYLPNNCTTPIQDALLHATGFGAIGGARAQAYTPADLENAIKSSFDTSNVTYYPEEK